MDVLALSGEETERGFPGLPRRRSERWRRRRPSGGGRKKKCEPCAAGRAVGLQSTFLASQPLFVPVPVPVDIKQAINGNNLEKWACVGISELDFRYQLCIADSHGKLKDIKVCITSFVYWLEKNMPECIHVLPWTKKMATTIMHKIRTLFLSWGIEKSSLIALWCAAMREVAASRATVPISWSCWYCVIRTVFWFYA